MARRVPLSTFVPRGAIEWLAEDPARRHRTVEGSLVFVDLSGFTALSERLARLGKVGAEEVTAVINTVFNGLLAVAYADGASLLKFGGDALLLLYSGEQHALHACRAADRMRHHLRGLNPMGSSAGNVELRMTIGVHSGPLEQFLLGRDHRDLVLAGPAITSVVRAEGAARPGEILVSPETAVLLPEGATRPRPDGLHRLDHAPDAGDFLEPVIKQLPSGVEVSTLLSGAVHTRLSQGVDEGEHRQAVVAFVRFQGVDDLLATAGPDALADALEEVVVTVQDAAGHYGVSYLASDIDANGGKVILLAGVPRASEFDGEQMLRTVGDVVRAGGRLPLQVGVHRGRVFAGVVGPHFRLTYTVIGDAVNLAARVMAHAEPGQVLSTPDALNRAQVLFDVRPVPPFRAKGKAQPVRAHAVGGVTARRLRNRQPRLPLAGRDAELADLMERLDRATVGRGEVVVLAGEAGLGKSRLVDELQERRPNVAFVLAAAQRYERNTAYHLVGRLLRQLLALHEDRPSAEALRAAVRARAPDLLPWVPLVGDAVDVDVEDTTETVDLQAAFRADRVAEVVADLIARTLPEPAVLVLEDVHWLDQDSLRVLAELANTHLPRHPWLVLATSRARLQTPDGVPDPPTIELRPLSPEAVRELTFAAAEQGMVALDRADEVATRSSGNPLFLEELVAGGADEGLPDSLETLVEARIDRLDGPDRDRLRLAAVLGNEFDLRLLAFVAGPEVAHDDDAWDRLRTFVEPAGHGVYHFRHALVRDAAYGALPYRRRRELHARAVEGLLRWHEGEEETVAELLALHAYNAGQWADAWRYNRMAGDRARERYANSTAANHYRRAIEVARHAEVDHVELATVYETLAQVLEVAGSVDEATRALARARRWAPDRDTPRLFRLEGLLRERLGRYTQAVRWYRRGLRMLEDQPDPVEAAKLYAGLAIIRLSQGRPRDGAALAEKALAHAESCGDRQALARAHFVMAWARDDLGDPRGEHHRAAAIELYEQLGDLRGLTYLHNEAGVEEADEGKWDDAVRHYEQAADFAVRTGDRASHAIQLINVGEIRSNQGRFADAEARLTEGLAIARAAGHTMATAYATMVLGRLHARAGDHDESAHRLTAATDLFARLRSRRLAGETAVFQAELHLFRGDARTAVTMTRELIDDADRGTDRSPVAQRILGCALLLDDEQEAAITHARRSLDMAQQAGARYEVALARVALAHAEGAAVPTSVDETLRRLGVITTPDALVFGPTAERSRAAATTRAATPR